VRSAIYQEDHSALNRPFLAYAVFAPFAAEAILLTLAIVVSPNWFAALVGCMFVAVMICTSFLYRNWPTGIRIDTAAISIGAVGSSRARRRSPTVSHQSWGLFTCPSSAVEDVRVVTSRAELRRLKKSSRYGTLNNRWGPSLAMTHCNIGVMTSPFMRAALVIEVDPTAVTATPIRPARFYSNFKDGHFSHLLRPEMSSTWIVPTRDPEGISKALESLASPRGSSDRR
jgi:hypothetical protein